MINNLTEEMIVGVVKMGKIKVLHVVTWYSQLDDNKLFAGVFHNELAKALQEEYDTAIWFPYDKKIISGVVSNTEWEVLTFRSNIPAVKSMKIIRAKEQFSTIIKTFYPDIIHAHVARGAGFFAVYLGRKYNIPVVVTEHELVEFMELNQIKNRVKQNYTYKNSTKNIVVSDYLKDSLSKRFKHVDFTVIYNGVVDPVRFISDATSTYRIADGINMVIVAGFYDKDIKGFQYLLPALKEINVSYDKKIYLHICGDGEYLDYYKNMAKDLGVIQLCRFYGHCDRNQLFNIINQMDFGVSASLYESAGVSIEEMLLIGKPVVVTRSGGANSLVSDENSIVVDKESTEQLVLGIKKMIDSYCNYDNASIRLNALNRFEMSHTVDKHIKLYDAILNK